MAADRPEQGGEPPGGGGSGARAPASGSGSAGGGSAPLPAARPRAVLPAFAARVRFAGVFLSLIASNVRRMPSLVDTSSW